MYVEFGKHTKPTEMYCDNEKTLQHSFPAKNIHDHDGAQKRESNDTLVGRYRTPCSAQQNGSNFGATHVVPHVRCFVPRHKPTVKIVISKRATGRIFISKRQTDIRDSVSSDLSSPPSPVVIWRRPIITKISNRQVLVNADNPDEREIHTPDSIVTRHKPVNNN